MPRTDHRPDFATHPVKNWHVLRTTRAIFLPNVAPMFYRRDLVEHFDWLAESEYLEEFCDEALVAVSMTAYGHGRDFVRFGTAWMAADHFVDRYGLRDFVDRLRQEDPLCPGYQDDLDRAA